MSSFQRVIKYLGIALAMVLTITIIGSICVAVFGIKVSKEGVSKKSDVSAVSDSYQLGEFKSMDINSGVAEVEIKVGEGYNVETKDVPDTMRVEVENGELVIRNETDWTDWLNFFGSNSWSKNSRIYVTVPEGYEAENIIVHSGTGDITISDIKADYMDIDGGVGDFMGTNITADTVDVDAGVGDITFRSSVLNDCDFDCGVGDINVEGTVTGSCDFDGGVGELKLIIEGNDNDYDLNLESGVGTIRLNGDKVDDYQKSGNGSNSLKVDGGVGSVTIEFTK